MPSPKKPKEPITLQGIDISEDIAQTPQSLFAEVAQLSRDIQDLTLFQKQLDDLEALVKRNIFTWSWEDMLPPEQQNRGWHLSENSRYALLSVTQTMHNGYYAHNSTIDLTCDLQLSVPDGMLVVMVPHGNLADLDVLCPHSFYGPGNHRLRLHFITTTRPVTLNTRDIVARLVALREA